MIHNHRISVIATLLVVLMGPIATHAQGQASNEANGVTANAYVESFPDNSVLIHVDFQNNNDFMVVVSSTTKVHCGKDDASYNQMLAGVFVQAHQSAKMNTEGCAHGPAQVLGEWITSVQQR